MKEQKTIPVVGTKLIEQYREEQISKHNWSVQHDIDVNKDGQFVQAAVSYLSATNQVQVKTATGPITVRPLDIWPSNWSTNWFKAGDDKIKNLSKAGALIAAEIDRLLQTSDNVDLEELYKYAKQQELFAEVRKVREEQIQRGLTKESLTYGKYTDAVIAYCANEDQRMLDEIAYKYWPFKGLPEPEDVIEDRRSDIINAIALLVAELEDLEE